MNFKIKKQIKLFFNKYYWRQHPDSALRYFRVVEQIKKLKLENAKILEVGSGSLGIIPYLKVEIDGIDIDFSGPKTKLLNKIKGKAWELPFKNNTYDIVISVDVVEHLSKDKREQAIFEQLRVSKKLAIVVCPVGSDSEKQDLTLAKYWKSKFEVENQFLSEHVENGLPKTEEILVMLDKSIRKLNKTANIQSIPSLNLIVRNILMRTWITKSKLLYYTYLKGYLLLLPILRLMNFGKCYRRVFMIEFRS